MASTQSGKTKQNRKEQATSTSEVSFESKAGELFKASFGIQKEERRNRAMWLRAAYRCPRRRKKLDKAAELHLTEIRAQEKRLRTELKAASAETQVEFVHLVFERIGTMPERLARTTRRYWDIRAHREFPTVAAGVLSVLRLIPLLSASDLQYMVEQVAQLQHIHLFQHEYLPWLCRRLSKHIEENGVTTALSGAIDSLAACLEGEHTRAEERRLARSLRDLAATSSIPPAKARSQPPGPLRRARLSPGEAWSDRALADLAAMKPAKAAEWNALLVHCEKTGGSTPSPTWLNTAGELLERIGAASFRTHIAEWFPLVDKPRTQPVEVAEYGPDANRMIGYTNGDILKGLAWSCSLCGEAAVARALTSLALSSYRKVPGIGPRLVRVGNACIWSLGEMPGREGLGQLAVLRIRVKFGTAQKVIEKALETTAERLGVPRDDLEEMSIPAYGLSEVGLRREQVGDCTAEIAIEGGSTQLRWSRAGKPLKSIPAAISKDFAEDVSELKAAVKDIQRMLGAQRERLDGLPLQRKSWPYPIWRERYLDHPLVGTLARRLIWSLSSGRRRMDAIFLDDRLVNVRDRAVDWPGEETRVELWHPIGCVRDEILAWREWLERHEVQQPFKQAHREVYLLTDAERETRVYSNRFAAHILRQHQFNALCGLRGWKNKLRLMVDADFPPPTLNMPAWGLRAEFWVESVGEDGDAINATGVFHYVSTDQVRFYRLPADPAAAPPTEPLPLEEVPLLVLSEVMRDVDLFVGVASVGNDPTWRDGGPEGYRDYWERFAFGSLTESAATRRQVLERIIPRLAIADRCSFSDRFLIVRGSLRTYKIHLGSGNILMQPDNRYLCIVKAPSGEWSPQVFLPFEGDGTLAIILSKAFLLAADDKITDPTILRQIKAR